MKTQREIDFTRGGILRPMLLFSIPVFLSNLFQILYNTVDTVVIGHTLGDVSLAAIGAATAVYDILCALAFGMGNGFAIVAGRHFGSRNGEMLRRTSAASAVIGFVAAAVITLGGYFALMPLLRLMSTPEEIIAEAYDYISVITLGIGAMLAYNLCAALLRAIGDSLMPLCFLIFSSCVNVALDIALVAGFGMGIRGAAAATVTAQGLSAALCLIYIAKRARALVPSRKDFRFDAPLYAEMTAQGLSLAMMECVVCAGGAILQGSINSLGYLVVAAHTAARRMFHIFRIPVSAVNTAVSTFASQNYGAGRLDRVRRGTHCGYLAHLVLTIPITLIAFVFGRAFTAWLSGSSEPVVLDNAYRYICAAVPCFIVLGVLNCSRNALQAIGEKVLPVLSSVIELLGKIVFAAVFVPKWGYAAVIVCEPLIWCLMVAELLPALRISLKKREKETGH